MGFDAAFGKLPSPLVGFVEPVLNRNSDAPLGAQSDQH